MLNYQIALTNVPFDNAYTNVRYFRTRQEQEGYFNVNTLFVNSISVNFNVGNLLKTTLTINAEEEHLNRLLSCNYLIVKNNSKVKDLNYFYYFITNSFQLSGNQISVDVELDVINTYLLDVEFTDCMIKRGHLNRFIDNGDGTVSFDGTAYSKLFEREPIQNVAKRLVKKTNLNLIIDKSNKFQEWINKNIFGWIYYYISEPRKRTIYDFNNNQTQGSFFEAKQTLNNAITAEISPLGIVAVPIFKKYDILRPSIYMEVNNNRYEIPDNIFAFKSYNNDNSYVYSAKFSFCPPFQPSEIRDQDFEIEEGGNYSRLIFKSLAYTSSWAYSGFYFKNIHYLLQSTTQGMITLNETPIDIETNMYISKKQLTFNKNEIIGSIKNSKFNPKLLAQDYFELKLLENSGNYFIYDLQKINANKFNVIYNEAMTADITKGFACLNIESANYSIECRKNLTGLVVSNDMSIMVDNDKLQEMLANNKNYYLQNDLKASLGILGGGVGIAEGIATNKPLMSIAGSTAIIGSIQNVIDKDLLTTDNLKNAPALISGTNKNAIFNCLYNEFKISIEEYDILENEKEMINDFMCQYGFTVNRLGNIKDYLDIRKYYNYVQAEIEEVKSNKTLISNQVKNKFVEIFKQGIRFWNTDTYSYEKENYEKWLEA